MENTIIISLIIIILSQIFIGFIMITESKRRKAQEKFIFDDIEYLTQLIKENMVEQTKIIAICDKLIDSTKAKNLILKGIDSKMKVSLSKKA